MRLCAALCLAFAQAGILACVSDPNLETTTPTVAADPTPSDAPTDAPDAPQAGSSAANKEGTEIKFGVFVPTESSAISVWPENYAGELLVLEVLPHYSKVQKGDVIARLETRSIDDQIRQADLEFQSASVRHAGLLEKHQIEEEAAGSVLEQARSALDRAQRSLDGWKRFELEFARRSDEIHDQQTANWVADQTDELAQLDAMYSADELTDATEEIVLKRSRRDLALSQTGHTLGRDQRKYEVEHDRAMDTEVREEAVRVQQASLDRLVRSQGIERRERQDAAARSEAGLQDQMKRLEKLRRDRDLLSIRAPRDGILLHGALKDYRAGRIATRVERGAPLSARTDLFVIADPAGMCVALDVGEANVGELSDGSSVVVAPVAWPEERLQGELAVEPLPSPRSSSPEGNIHEATVEIDKIPAAARFGMRARVELPDEQRTAP